MVMSMCVFVSNMVNGFFHFAFVELLLFANEFLLNIFLFYGMFLCFSFSDSEYAKYCIQLTFLQEKKKDSFIELHYESIE